MGEDEEAIKLQEQIKQVRESLPKDSKTPEDKAFYETTFNKLTEIADLFANDEVDLPETGNPANVLATPAAPDARGIEAMTASVSGTAATMISGSGEPETGNNTNTQASEKGTNMSDASSVLARIKDEEIRFVDLRFTDPRGKMQHLTMDIALMDAEAFADGVPFDGSSIAGWKAINESDMLLMPVPETAHIDPFYGQKTMAIDRKSVV